MATAPWKLALAQMRVIGGDHPGNLDRAESMIRQAAQDGAQLVLLPEALDMGWTHPSAVELAQPLDTGETTRRLCQAARVYRLFLCFGLVERDRDQLFNTALLVGPDGRILLHHRKLNELAIAHDLYAQGDRLQVVSTPLGTLGLMICSDAFAHGQIISRTLAWMGADVILSPSSWAVPPEHNQAEEPYGQLWLDHYQPVARRFRIWIASASSVGPLTAGPWAGRNCIGCSMVIDPRGRPVLRGPYGPEAETLLFQQIEPTPRPARGDEWNQRFSRASSARKAGSAADAGTPPPAHT